jgi:antitoxin component YwqK of YwqJK toxin-antitoxin module
VYFFNFKKNMLYMRLFIIFLLAGNLLFAQAQEKTTDTQKVKTESIWITVKNGNKETKYRQKELRYNKEGNLIEEITFSNKNKIVIHRAYQYEKGVLVRVFELDSKGTIVCRTDYSYQNTVLTKKKHYNGKGEVIGEEEIVYNYHE